MKQRIVHLGVTLIACIICATLVHCEAQVTFSTAWKPGKRVTSAASYIATIDSGDKKPLRPTIKSVTAVCHMLLNQIRALAKCAATKYEPRADDAIFDTLDK